MSPLVHQALSPGCSRDKLLLKKVLQKTLGSTRQLGWLLPSTKPAASVGGFPLPFC